MTPENVLFAIYCATFTSVRSGASLSVPDIDWDRPFPDIHAARALAAFDAKGNGAPRNKPNFLNELKALLG